jgi:type I restriction enzyme, S subunit
VELAKGRAAQPHLNAEDLGDILIMTGDPNRENETASDLEVADLWRRRIGERLESQLSLLAEHRQALITSIVTGELDIPGAAA